MFGHSSNIFVVMLENFPNWEIFPNLNDNKVLKNFPESNISKTYGKSNPRPRNKPANRLSNQDKSIVYVFDKFDIVQKLT